ncbi:MAG: glycoside hydrolase family 2 TIM barrel-domain containing protein [Elusimicrobiota bacterium]
MKKITVSLILSMLIICFLQMVVLGSEIRIKNTGDKIIDYEKYGKFKNIGTAYYKYKITDKEGLSRAAGEGVYPNREASLDPVYKKLLKQQAFEDDIWKNVNTGNPEVDFFAWATANVVNDNYLDHDPGTRQFFTAEALKNGGSIVQAIKAYYSIVINFPQTACWGIDGSFVWYVAPVAIDRINVLCREYADDLGFTLVDASVEIENKDDTDLQNDVVVVNPGRFVSNESRVPQKVKAGALNIIKQRGEGAVQVVQYDNGQWQLLVKGKPYIVKGITYAPTKIGTKVDEPGRETKWMKLDTNKNGKSDAAYDSWVDSNSNNKRDSNEPIVGDFQLLKDMGVNTIRMYHMFSKKGYEQGGIDKDILRDLYKTYGIRVILGDFIGAYGIGSDSSSTDYRDPLQRKMMKDSVKRMVMDHKDEPYVLMWAIGNENDLPDVGGVNATATNASKFPKEYTEFVNEVAAMIHKLDPNHPVVVGNYSLDLLDYYHKYSPEIDIFGVNAYLGGDSFGPLWKKIKKKIEKPVIITEYGCDAYHERQGVNEIEQANYHKGNWKDIEYNTMGQPGEGICLGGIIFEWLDEWWKDSQGDSPFEQQRQAQYAMPFPDGWGHEEWFGIVGQGNGENSPFQRNLREAYYTYKDLWNLKK